jgi:hypothetical protein
MLEASSPDRTSLERGTTIRSLRLDFSPALVESALPTMSIN